MDGLDREYDLVVLNVQESHVTLQEVLHKLLSHKSRLERRNMNVSLFPSANLTGVNNGANLTAINGSASSYSSSDMMNSGNETHMVVPHMNNGFDFKPFQSQVNQNTIQPW